MTDLPSPPKSGNSLAWKVFFWINAALILLAGLSLPLMIDLSPLDYLDFAVSIGITLSLYGFAYLKPIGSVVFWRYFFYVALLDSIIYIIVLPLLGALRYGQEFNLDIFYGLEWALSLAMLYALNQYAYKRTDIWL